MNGGQRIPSLDGLRGIAALAVMEFHFDTFFLPQARLSEFTPGLGEAYLAVDFFFLLSGFVMAHVYDSALASNWRANWQKFAMARFARIYPLFAVTTLAMLIVFAISRLPIWIVSFSGRSAALQPVLLQQWASGLSWNYPSWSISSEAEAYIFFVLSAGVLLKSRPPRLIVACCISILIAVCAVNEGRLDQFHGLPAILRALCGFSFGVLLYRGHGGEGGFDSKLVALAALLLIVLSILTEQDSFIVGAFVCVIYYTLNDTSVLYKTLNSAPLIALGSWSYSIYLSHAPIHYSVMAAFAMVGYPVTNLSFTSALFLIVVTTSAVVGISAVLHTHFEKPARRFILSRSRSGLPVWQSERFSNIQLTRTSEPNRQ